MPGRTGSPRAVLINDEIFPFRLPFFRALARSGLSVHVLFMSRAKHRRWQLPEDLGFDHQFVPSLTLHLTKASFDEPRDVHIPLTLWWRLLRLRPDVVVAYAFSVPTWTAALYCRLFRVPLVIWSEGTRHTEADNSRLQNLARRLLVPRAAALLAGSRDARDRLTDLGAASGRVQLVSHAADASEYEPTSGIETRQLLYVGAVTELKGVDHLLEAFLALRRRLPDVALKVVGEGPLLDWVQRRVEAEGLGTAVSCTGFLQPADLPAHFSRAGVFVFPTLRDTFGQVIAEAVAAGLPIVTSPYAGAAREFVIEGRNGFVRDPHDHAGFAAAIESVISSESQRSAMAAESARMSRTRNVESVAEAVSETLAQTAATRPAIKRLSAL